MNASLADDESSFNNQCENSNWNEVLNYIAFTSVVKSKHVEDSETLEGIKQSDSLKEELEDDWNILRPLTI